jgi:hypothetical protein
MLKNFILFLLLVRINRVFCYDCASGTQCSYCGVGAWCNNGAEGSTLGCVQNSCVSPHGSAQYCCGDPCPSSCGGGEYLHGSYPNCYCATCRSCGIGYYQSFGCFYDRNRECTACTNKPPNSYYDTAYSCNFKCNTGYFLNTSTNLCDICPVEHYCSNNVKTQCTTCVNGTSYPSSPCTGTDNRVCTNCTVCSLGTVQCRACTNTSNTFCAGCTQCPMGQYNVKCSQCATCNPGYTCMGTGFLPQECKPATYCPTSGMAYPLPCPQNTFSNASKSISCFNCTVCANYTAQACTNISDAVCSPCEKGYFLFLGTCLICPPGYFCALGVLNKCPGNKTSVSGSQSASQCTCYNLPTRNAYYTDTIVCTYACDSAWKGVTCERSIYSDKYPCSYNSDCNYYMCSSGEISGGYQYGCNQQSQSSPYLFSNDYTAFTCVTNSLVPYYFADRNMWGQAAIVNRYCPIYCRTSCPAGYYLLDCGCLICPLEKYCPDYSTVNPCISGDYCPSLGSTLNQSCAAGYYCPLITSQYECPESYYCPSRSLAPIFCPPVTNNKTAYCPKQSTAYTFCPAGSFCTNISTKVSCPIGYFCEEGTSFATACSNGSYCPKQSTNNSNCTEGYYCPNPAIILVCGPGFYCPARSVTPQTCPAGYLCPTSTTVQPTACLAGQYCAAGSSVATQCTAGFYCPNASIMLVCPKDRACPPSSINPKQCNVSNYINSNDCTQCPTNQFCNGTHATPCSTCPTEKYMVSQCNASSNIVCADCKSKCSSDSFENVSCSLLTDRLCTQCPDNYFCNSVIKQMCSVPCSAGTYITSPCNKTNDRSSCFSCPANSFCNGSTIQPQLCSPACPAYAYENVSCTATTNRYCSNCSANSFCNGVFQRPCSICPAGKFVNQACTSSNDTVCTDCPANYYCEGATIPAKQCPVGSYISTTGSSSIDQCLQSCTSYSMCDYEGCKVSYNRGLWCNCRDAISSSYFLDNPSGYLPGYSNPAISTCDICIQWDGLNGRWYTCPPCKKQCLPGEYVENCQCKVCSPGFACIDNRPSSCSNGTYSLSGSSTCSSCSTCPAFHYIASPCNFTNNIVCSKCQQCNSTQYFKSNCSLVKNAQCSQCTVCKPYEYVSAPCSNFSDTLCLACPADFYCNGTHATPCTVCPAEAPYETQMCTNTTNRLCNPCFGSFCTSGFYEATCTPQRICLPCPNGSYCPNGKQAQACSSCGSNQYVKIQCNSTSDTVCANCSTCLSETYQTQACTATNDTVCQPCLQCGSTGEVTPCTPLLNRKCNTQPCTQYSDCTYSACVNARQYNGGWGCSCVESAYFNYNFQAYQTTCNSNAPANVCVYQLGIGVSGLCPARCPPTCAAGTYNLYCSCVQCADPCLPGFYESTPCTQNSNRVCSPCPLNNNSYCNGVTLNKCSVCANGTYVVSPCTISSNTVCSPCPPESFCVNGVKTTCGPLCQAPFENLLVQCSNTTDRICCTSLSCDVGFYKTASCSVASRKKCEACPANYYCPGDEQRYACVVCDLGFYAIEECTSSTDRMCLMCPTGYLCNDGINVKECTVCGAGKYTVTPCNPPALDTVCGACINKPNNTYYTGPGTSISNCPWSVCTNVCPNEYFRSAECTSTSNTVCSNCRAMCLPGIYVSHVCARALLKNSGSDHLFFSRPVRAAALHSHVEPSLRRLPRQLLLSEWDHRRAVHSLQHPSRICMQQHVEYSVCFAHYNIQGAHVTGTHYF